MQTVFCADGGTHPRPSSSPPRRLRGKRKEARGKRKEQSTKAFGTYLFSFLYPLSSDRKAVTAFRRPFAWRVRHDVKGTSPRFGCGDTSYELHVRRRGRFAEDRKIRVRRVPGG